MLFELAVDYQIFDVFVEVIFEVAYISVDHLAVTDLAVALSEFFAES